MQTYSMFEIFGVNMSYLWLFFQANPSMFTYHHSSHIVILLLYVDDIILTRSCPSLISSLINILSHQFPMKDLGNPYHVLGLQVSLFPTSLFLLQHKYTIDLLRKFHIYTCKPIRTPSMTRTNPSLMASYL